MPLIEKSALKVDFFKIIKHHFRYFRIVNDSHLSI